MKIEIKSDTEPFAPDVHRTYLYVDRGRFCVVFNPGTAADSWAIVNLVDGAARFGLTFERATAGTRYVTEEVILRNDHGEEDE